MYEHSLDGSEKLHNCMWISVSNDVYRLRPSYIDQFVKQLLGTLFALDKHQQWRSGPLGTHRERKIGRETGKYCTV
jgi:hypothetical protein